MATVRGLFLALVVGLFCFEPTELHRVVSTRAKCFKSERTIYDQDHRFTTLNGTEVRLSQFRGENFEMHLFMVISAVLVGSVGGGENNVTMKKSAIITQSQEVTRFDLT